MRGPYATSFALHAGIAVTLAAGAALTTTVVRHHEDEFLTKVAQQQQQEEKQAAKEAAQAVVEAAKTQVALSVTDLVAGHIAQPDADKILADAQDAVEDLFAQESNSEAQESQPEDSSASDHDHLIEEAEKVALQRALTTTEQYLQQALIAQVREKIRNEVVPEINARVDRELKQQLGEQLKNKLQEAVFDDKKERLSALAENIRTQARVIDQAKDVTDAHAQREAVAAAQEHLRTPLAHAAAQDPLLDERSKTVINDTGTADALAKAENPSAAKKILGQRAEELGKLAQTLDEHAGRRELDDVQRQLAAKTQIELSGSVAVATRARIESTVVPAAAKQLADAVEKDLAKLGLPKDRFQEAVTADIGKALHESMPANDAAVAWMKSERDLGLRQTGDLTAARTEVSKAAEALEKAANEQLGARTDDPAAQRQRAAAIAKAEDSARAVLGQARSVSLAADDRIEEGLKSLRNSQAAEHAERSAQAMEKRLDDPAKAEAAAAVKDLRANVEQLRAVGEALGREESARPQPSPASARELAAKPVAIGSEASVAKVTQAVADGQQLTTATQQAVDKAASQLNVDGVLSSNDRIAQLTALRGKLTEALSKAANPRAMGTTQLAAGLSSGLSAGLAAKGRGGDARGRVGDARGRVARVHSDGWNRKLYEQFVKDLRNRTNPSTALEAPKSPESLDSVAPASSVVEPAVVYVARDEAEIAALAEKKAAAALEKPREPLKPTFPSPAVGYAPYQATALKIDGDLSDWGPLTNPLTLAWNSNNTPLADGPKVYMRWSNDGVYLACAVADPTGMQRNNLPWSGDCVEMWLDTDNVRKSQMNETPTAQQLCFIPFGMDKDPSQTFCEIARGFRGTNNGQFVFDTEHTRGWTAAKEVAGGYVVEGFVRKAYLSKPVLLPGMWVALNLSVNTGIQGQSGREMQWSASKGIQTWDRPDTWGDVLLLGANATVRALSRPADGSEPKPIDHLVAGQAFTIEISDGDLNVDLKYEDRIAATVSVVDRDEPVLVVLKETGPDTGVFRCSVGTRPLEDEAAPNVVRVHPGDRIRISYQDVRAAYGETDRVVTADIPVAIPVMRFGAK